MGSQGVAIMGLTQVGIVVKDIEKVVGGYWNVLGVGPWQIVTFAPPSMIEGALVE